MGVLDQIAPEDMSESKFSGASTAVGDKAIGRRGDALFASAERGI